ncbi:MAG: replicative DNA helicase [Myxococcales bacterium]|nr:replicative DNA helicase [Myxococcales bacterium]
MSATPPDDQEETPVDGPAPTEIPADDAPPIDDQYAPSGDDGDGDDAGGAMWSNDAPPPEDLAPPPTAVSGVTARVTDQLRSPVANLPRASRNSGRSRTVQDDLRAPFNLDAERALLSSLMIDSRAMALVQGSVEPAEFYDARHGLIFKAVYDLFRDGHEIEPVTVLSQLRKEGNEAQVGGLGYLITLTGHAGSSLSVEHYASTIAGLAQVRRILRAAHTILTEGYKRGTDPDEVVDLVQTQLIGALDRSGTVKHKHIADVVDGVFQNVLEARARGKEVVGFDTGFRDLNAITYGFHRKTLVILAARPAMGKTALALNVALSVALQRVPDGDRAGEQCSVMIFSLEMGADELVQRLLAQRARVGLGDLKKGTVSDDDVMTLREASGDLSGLKIYIDDTPGISPVDLRARAKRVALSEGLDLIVVDYLQLMKGSGGSKQSREQEISEISRSMKGLSKELNVAVIALSQLNRSLESRADKRPIMSDLRESGAIEQDADMILFVYRDWVYHKETAPEESAELIIGKHRAGKLGTVNLHFEGKYTRFSSVDDRFNDDFAMGTVPYDTGS